MQFDTDNGESHKTRNFMFYDSIPISWGRDLHSLLKALSVILTDVKSLPPCDLCMTECIIIIIIVIIPKPALPSAQASSALHTQFNVSFVTFLLLSTSWNAGWGSRVWLFVTLLVIADCFIAIQAQDTSRCHALPVSMIFESWTWTWISANWRQGIDLIERGFPG